MISSPAMKQETWERAAKTAFKLAEIYIFASGV